MSTSTDDLGRRTPDVAPAAPNEREARLAALMQRIASGDRSAFDELYRDTSAMLFGLVLRINRDRGQAEDLLQEIFMVVWRQAPSFDLAQGQVLTWLTTIARHRAIDSLRRRAAQPATISQFGGLDAEESGDEPTDLFARVPSDEPGPLELLDEASRAHELSQCMDRLSGDQRSCLALAYYQGLSHAEVATHMDQPLGTVKSWVRRGLQNLRACLDRASARLQALGKVA